VRQNRYAKYGFFFVLPSFIYFLLVFFYPLLLAFWNSVHEVTILQGVGDFAGFAKFSKVYSSTGFRSSAWVTVKYVMMVVPLLLVVDLAVANAIANRKRRSVTHILSTLFFLPLVTSMVSAGMMWDWIFDPAIGVVNTALSDLGLPHDIQWLRSPDTALFSAVIIGVWIRMAFGIIIFIGGIESIPGVYYEVADMDGASEGRKFFNVTLPLLNPQIIMVLTIELIFAFKAFDQIYVATKGGPAGATKTIMIHLIKDVFQQDYAAANVITVTLLLFLFVISYLQRILLRRGVEY
jgi:ABC-type sugar transport system permease subunit